MPAVDINILRLVGNRVNAKIITLLKRHPMNPRDLSEYIGKNEADIVRRLRVMEKAGLVESKWGTRLGKNVKLYELTTGAIDISFQLNGVEVEFKKKGKARIHKESIDTKERDQPQNTETLIGREAELRILSGEDIRFFWIVGVAGMGKSSLAYKFSQTIQGGDKTFWHTFKEIDTLTYLTGKIRAFLSRKGIRDLSEGADVLDVADMEDESENLESMITSLNKVECLMIFDDFHKVRDEKISIFLKNLKQHCVNKILVLSRSKPTFYLDDIHSKELVLQGLPLGDAKEMMSQLGLDIDDKAGTEVWRRFSGHPMTLKIFSLFAKEKNLPYPYDHPFPSINTISDYFQKEILEILSSDEQNILLTLSVYRTPVKSKAFKGININQRNLGFMLHALEKRMIISRTASGKFVVHDMLRDILYPMLTYPEDAHASAAQYYLSEGGAENVVESLYHFSRCQDIEKICEILRGEVIDERYRLIEEGYAAPLAEILSQINLQNIPRDQLAYFYNLLGKALSMLQRWDEAKENLEKASKLSKNLADENLLAYSLRNYGESLYLHGDLHAAEKSLLKAINSFCKCAGTEKALRSIYMILARLYFVTGRADESKKYSDMAISVSAEENVTKA